MIDEYIYFLNTARVKDAIYLHSLSEKFKQEGYCREDAMHKAIGEAVRKTHAMGGLAKMLDYIDANFSAEEAS